MKARFLRAPALESLRADIHKNLPLYRDGNFEDISVDTSNWLEVDAEINVKKLRELKSPEGKNNFEVENCIIAYQSLENLSPYKARDERLWAYLTHTDLLDYSRKRWPIPENDNEAIAHIQKHFFAREKRQVERDNAISRLWWLAHLCHRIPSMSLTESLEAFLFMSDVRANIVERPTTSQSIPVFSAIIRKLSKSYKGKKALFEREVFRKFMREINSAGGSRLLDCLETAQIESLLDSIIKNRLALSVI